MITAEKIRDYWKLSVIMGVGLEIIHSTGKGNYNFKNDIELSEYYEKELIRRIKEEGSDQRKALPDCEMKTQVHRNSNDHDWKYKMDIWNFHSWWRKVKTTNERRANADPEI